MFKILEKKALSDAVDYMKVLAPDIAKKARPGQFIILRSDEKGERIPLTIAEYNPEEGSVSVIFQKVGASTMALGELKTGDYVMDFVGPLGNASELDGYKRVAVIGGGLGCAIAYPQAKYLHEKGACVDLIAGFRSKDLIILEKEMQSCSTNLIVLTDDGSNGNKGLVTDGLESLIKSGANYDLVIAIGPPIMMKFISKLTLEHGIKTVVSLNPIMIDGTGMCGGCRVTVGGEIKFACIHGPDFDGHKVDYDELMQRNKTYHKQEGTMTKQHNCRLPGMNPSTK